MFKKLFTLLTIPTLFFSCISQPDNSGKGKEYVKVGAAAPVFSVSGKDGETFVSPDNFKGKTTLLMFFTTWCPYCQKQSPHVQQAWNHFKENADVQFICIARGGEGSYLQTPEMVEQYWKDNNFDMQWYIDPDRQVFNMFAETDVPRFYIIDSSAKVVWSKVTNSFTSEQFIEEMNKFVNPTL